VKVVSELGGKATWQVDDKTNVILSARDVRTAYLDSPFTSRAMAYGVAATRQLFNDITLGVELMRTRGEQFGGEEANGTMGLISLAKAFGGDDKKRSALLPQAELMRPAAQALQVPGR
jgi:hypothetical protein